MSDEVLLRMSEDLGDIKATLKGLDSWMKSNHKRMDDLEDKVHDIDKKQFGMSAVASVLGGLVGTFWTKLIS